MREFWRKPLDADKKKRIKGHIIIVPELCKGCSYCVEFCPKKVLAISAKFNSKGYHPPEIVKGEECVDCRLCELVCPDFAIYLDRNHELEGK